MAPNDTDRRRFLLGAGLTLLALPALWWANQQADSGAPNVATVGIDVGDGQSEPTPPTPRRSARRADAELAPATTAAGDHGPADHRAGRPVGADLPRRPERRRPVVARPRSPSPPRRPSSGITTSASYRSSISPIDTCLTSDIKTGTTITVVNLNNGHSVTCIATRVYSTDDTGLIMHTDTFSQIADLTDAPIPVEISQ